LIKLLNASFTRLRKNKLFWLLTIFSIGLAIFMTYAQYHQMQKYGTIVKVEQLILNYSKMIGIIISIFTSLFLGEEYASGGVRNKISIGHKRSNIYLSNLLITVMTSLYSYLLFMLIIIILGIPIFGKITIPIINLLKLIGCIFAMIFSFSSIFTFIAMVISNKTVIAIFSIVLAFALMIFALVCLSNLSETEYINTTEIVNFETNEVIYKEIPNPHYLSEQERKIYQTLLDINPSGQGFQITGRIASNLKLLPIYSLAISILFTSTGILLFKKKELK